MFFIKHKNESLYKKVGKSNTKSLLPTLEENFKFINNSFNDTQDLMMREVIFHNDQGYLIYLETMVDTEEILERFLKPLAKVDEDDDLINIITDVNLKETSDLNELISSLLKGYSVLLVEGKNEAFSFQTKQKNDRSIEEPETEKVVRGSHQGFVENIDMNMNLIRQRIINQNLVVKFYELGSESKTKVAIVYMNQKVDSKLINEIEGKILSISNDDTFSTGQIEEYIEEYPLSPFPQILYTERPDQLEAHLMEGRVGIMSEGSPDAIIMPVTFYSFFQSPDDFNNRLYTGSIFRLLRLLSFWGTLILPALYIAVISFHFEIIPYEMITLVKSSIENIPFHPFFEVLFMAITIELIRESGMRLPSPIGETIGIVGGLIIGDAVVSAGLISNTMVIVIALTAIMSFTIPSYELSNTVRILTLPVMIGATIFGFVGIVASILFIIMHMCKIQSFGIPYISPVISPKFNYFKNAIIRFPAPLINYHQQFKRKHKQGGMQSIRKWIMNARTK